MQIIIDISKEDIRELLDEAKVRVAFKEDDEKPFASEKVINQIVRNLRDIFVVEDK